MRNDRTGQEVAAELVAAMPCEDLALVRITNPADRADFEQVELAAPDSLSQGEQVIALGYPGTAATARPEDFGNAPALGHRREHLPDRRRSTTCPGSDVAPLTDAVQHTAAINHGNSGGPLFDLEGKQVGINTAIYFANGAAPGGRELRHLGAPHRGAAAAAEGRRLAGLDRRDVLAVRQPGDRRADGHRHRLHGRPGPAGGRQRAAGHRDRGGQRPRDEARTRTTAAS